MKVTVSIVAAITFSALICTSYCAETVSSAKRSNTVTNFAQSIAAMADGKGTGISPDLIFPTKRKEVFDGGFTSHKFWMIDGVGVINQITSNINGIVGETLVFVDTNGAAGSPALPVGDIDWKLVSGFRSDSKGIVKLTRIGSDENGDVFVQVVTTERNITVQAVAAVPGVKIVEVPEEGAYTLEAA